MKFPLNASSAAFSVRLCLLLVLCGTNGSAFAGRAKPLLEKGWAALVKDHDSEAFRYFNEAYEAARAQSDREETAEALLNMGICSYSVSYTRGLQYAFRAMSAFRQLEAFDPKTAINGRSRCLQLISTIYSRQGNYEKAIAISREALSGLSSTDATGSRGLMYNSLGVAFGKLGQPDSSEYYHRLALRDHQRTHNVVYLPGSLLYVAEMELKHGNLAKSRWYFDRSLAIADSTQNRQAIVSAQLGIGNWCLRAGHNEAEAEQHYRIAEQIALQLTDRAFYLNVLQQWFELRELQGRFREALHYQQEMNAVRDALVSTEKQAMIRQLEVQFDVSEKERKLRLIQKEQAITSLTNYLLWGTLGVIVLVFSGIVWFMNRIRQRDRLLLQAQQELVSAKEQQQVLREQQLQQELTYKESQLSAMTLQMVQKNEWITDLKNRIAEGTIRSGEALEKLLEKELGRDQEWTDFNVHFESINTHFYHRLKQAFPDISPNDLKLCALIKLNLSIKELSAILNISPDSVKTARYRLRKKFQLGTEANLTDFILSIS